MNINEFYQFKNNYLEIDIKLIKQINNIKNKSNIKYKESKKVKKILKNKFHFNIILNKVSELNYKELIKDIFSSIIFDEKKINEFSNYFFNKIIKDSTFVIPNSLFFIEFIKGLNYHYSNINLDILINYVEIFFQKIFTEEFNEEERCNYLLFLHSLCFYNFYDKNLLIDITEYLINLEDIKYYYDIYKWFQINKKLLKVKKYIKVLNKKIVDTKNNKRLNTLLNSLFNTEITVEKNIKTTNFKTTNLKTTNFKTTNFKTTNFKTTNFKTTNLKTTNFKTTNFKTTNLKTTNLKTTNKVINNNDIEIENLIQEYLILEDLEEIKYYIEEYCVEAKSKNNFCLIVIKTIFKESNKNIDKIFNLLNYLIKNKIIYKSNLSRGLIYFYKSENEINKIIMLKIIKFLKKNNITRSIEFIIDKFV